MARSKQQRYVPALSRLATVLLAAAVLLVAFSWTARAQTFQVLHTFSGGDGKSPDAGLSMDRAGNLYGTTLEGGFSGNECAGNDGCGTVFELAHQGAGWLLHPLYRFQGPPSDGASPLTRVIFGPDGALYGATADGGSTAGNCAAGLDLPGCGTVFKLTPPANFCRSFQCNWSERQLYAFSYSDGSAPRGEIAFDAAGNLYGATSGGGAEAYGTAYELTPASGAWSLTSLHSFTRGDDGDYPWGGVQLDSAGNVYGTTTGYGEGSGTVFQLLPSLSGWSLNNLYSFPAGGGSEPQAGVILDQAGNLYGSTCNGSQGSVIFELSPSNGSWTYNTLYSFGSDSCPTANLAMDTTGNLYGTTAYGGTHSYGNVFKLTPSDGSWVYTDLHDFTGSGDGGHPYSNVVIDANGNLYGTASIGGSGNGVVWEITP